MYKHKFLEEPFHIQLFIFSEKVTKDELNQFRNDLETLLNSHIDFYLVFDLTKLNNFDINLFTAMNKYIYQNEELVKLYMKASSIVIRKTMKPIINLAMNFNKPLVPNLVVSKIEKSIEFLINVNQQILIK